MAEPVEPKSLFKKIKDRQAQLADVRKAHEGVWKEVIEMLRPELSLWGATEAGAKRNLQVYNAGAEEAMENWADGMQGHLASPSLAWFKYGMADQALNDIPEVRKWLQATEELIYAVLRDSDTFYPTLDPVFRDGGSIGNACMFIEETKVSDGIDCSTFHPREIRIAENSRGKINVWHREFMMTAKNAAEEFDKDDLSQPLNNSLRNNPLNRHKFIHAIYEKTDPILDGEKDVPDRPWISIYIEVNADPTKEEPLRISGYWSKPFAYWRLTKPSDSVYGWGLGCSALVDVYALNTATRINMQAAEGEIRPPLLIHKSLRGRVQVKPGGRTYFEQPAETVDRLFQSSKNILAGVDREERIQAALDRRFLVPFFLMLARAEKPMTATEIIEKTGERSILLGPKIGRLESDLLDPIHDRVFEIALSNGWLPQPPQILLDQSDGKIDVQYMGPLAQAQKRLFQTRRTQEVIGQIGPIMQLKPDELDWFDLGKTATRIARDGSWPEEEIRTKEQVAAIRQGREDAIRAEKEMELLERGAAQVPNLQKTSEPGSPMEQMTGAPA